MVKSKAVPTPAKCTSFKFAPVTCTICYETITNLTKIRMSDNLCGQHPACRSCMRQYLQHGTHADYAAISCPTPGCAFTYQNTANLVDATLNTDSEKEHWWKSALNKAYITNKVTCPFINCKAVFDADMTLTKECKFTECYECHRGFCIACMNSWHPGEKRIVNDEREALLCLAAAKQNNWTRCPTCKKFVQKISGCQVIACVCGSQFCYRCGSKSINHACSKACNAFSQERLMAEKQSMYSL